ncbi:hypothetical protein [Hymenobacter negativus]|uniref:Uncharacterized protein n=1 Tax=Hymenobacter negativus TaxID=2795026 RepID=A0ABS3Q8B5_9BACT|nr:hypothetical protein [Hymenobacter negativus]MBO2007481.1 hypothetical protein [Hymenobacter negativus]
MLDFYFIPDELSNMTSSMHLKYAGCIEEEEFEMAQKAGLIENHADYYGRFRWSRSQVLNKVELLANCPFRMSIALNEVLTQAKATDMGLLAIGD